MDIRNALAMGNVWKLRRGGRGEEHRNVQQGPTKSTQYQEELFVGKIIRVDLGLTVCDHIMILCISKNVEKFGYCDRAASAPKFQLICPDHEARSGRSGS